MEIDVRLVDARVAIELDDGLVIAIYDVVQLQVWFAHTKGSKEPDLDPQCDQNLFCFRKNGQMVWRVSSDPRLKGGVRWCKLILKEQKLIATTPSSHSFEVSIDDGKLIYLGWEKQ